MTKKTIFQVLKEKLGEKPATREEIKQLKLDLQRAQIKASIAEAKRKAKGNRPNLASKLVPQKQEQKHRMFSEQKPRLPESYVTYIQRKPKKIKYQPPIERPDTSNEVEKVFGSNKSKDYRSITG